MARSQTKKDATQAAQAQDTQVVKTGVRDRLWPININRLKAHGIPGTKLLKMPPTIWVSSIIINILGIGLPILILQVYDRVIPNQSLNTLLLLALGFVGILGLEFLLRLGRAYTLGWAATQFQMTVGQLAIKRLLTAPLEIVGQDRTQTQLDRLTSISRLADFFGGPNSLLIIDLPFVIILIATMGLIAGYLVLIPLSVLLVFAGLTLRYGRELGEQFEAREAQDNRTYDFVAECLHGVITLKGFAMEPFMLRRFERLQNSRAITNYRTIMASTSAQSVSAILGNVTIIATVSVGAIFAVIGDLSIGTLAACTLLSGRIIQPVVRFAGLWSEFQKLELALQEAADLFRLEQRTTEFITDGREGPPTIQLMNVSYQENNTPLLGPVNLTIDGFECFGITGPDNEAKSLFLKTVTGLRMPHSGDVVYNNINVEHYRNGNPGSIVMVGPKSSVFDGTILENFTLFGTGPTVDEVRWAAQMTGVDYDINCLPQGYDTPIGDGAMEKLPQGLIRRILLTRAIAMLPKILVLDEPQMFLDNSADKKLVQCLSALRHNMTIVISTMRPSYFPLADRLYSFEDGAISQIGGTPRHQYAQQGSSALPKGA